MVRLIQTKPGTRWSLEHVRAHPDWLFIFGENRDAKAFPYYQAETQACIRCYKNDTKVPNSIGLRTCYKSGKGYRDNTYGGNAHSRPEIEADGREILDAIRSDKYTTVVLPGDGIGTGVAALNTDPNAWRTLMDIQQQLRHLALDKDIFNAIPKWNKTLYILLFGKESRFLEQIKDPAHWAVDWNGVYRRRRLASTPLMRLASKTERAD